MFIKRKLCDKNCLWELSWESRPRVGRERWGSPLGRWEPPPSGRAGLQGDQAPPGGSLGSLSPAALTCPPTRSLARGNPVSSAVQATPWQSGLTLTFPSCPSPPAAFIPALCPAPLLTPRQTDRGRWEPLRFMTLLIEHQKKSSKGRWQKSH